jgi:hypothetical protein
MKGNIHSPIIILIILLMLIPTPTSGSDWDIDTISISQGTLEYIDRFSVNLLLSTTDANYAHHVEPTIAIGENDTIYAGWKNSETDIGGGARVSFTRSDDSGLTWLPPFDMPMFVAPFQISRQSDPWLVWHDEVIYYAYLEFVPGDPFSQITVAKSADNGDTWDLVPASDGSGFADKETMTIASDGAIYVAYDDVLTQGNEIILSKSVDGGDTYQDISVIEPEPVNETYNQVAPYLTMSNNDDVYVAYTHLLEVGGNLMLDRSLDGGLTFEGARRINDDGNYSEFTVANGRPAKITLPVIRFDQEDRLYVLWADLYEPDNHSWDVYLRYSDDYGTTWSGRILVNDRAFGDQWLPDMDIDSEGRLHLAFYEEVWGAYRPYYRTLEFVGEDRTTPLFSDQIPIATLNTSSEYTRPGDYMTIRVDQNDIPHIVWTDGREEEMDIYYSHGIPVGDPTTTTPPPIAPPEVMTIVIVIVVIGAIAIVIILLSRR